MIKNINATSLIAIGDRSGGFKEKRTVCKHYKGANKIIIQG